MIPAAQVARLKNAIPFWISLTFIPVAWFSMSHGGWAVLALPAFAFGFVSILDALGGVNLDDADTETTHDQLFWYRLVTMIWLPIEVVLLFVAVWMVGQPEYFNGWERFGLASGFGVISGGIGIVYAHELMHQKSRFERRIGDALMALALYGHFRSEHLLVHHRYVGTPRDAVTARYNENFYRFFARVLVQCFSSAWRAEAAMLERKKLSKWDRSNPFFQYAISQALLLLVAYLIGGSAGLVFFLVQAFFAVLYLEVINYVEHYGLTRKYLGDGKYEHVMPRHSWNSAHKITNWLLINLQRHSDHHYKPSRAFPLLQNFDESEAPQLPFGYTIMAATALMPPLWLRKMNPRVKKWRAMFYPEITDWTPYKEATNPNPKGSS